MGFRVRLLAVMVALGLLLTPLVAQANSAAAPKQPPAPAVTMTPEALALTNAASWLSKQFVDGQHLPGFDGVSPDPANTIDGAIALYVVDGFDQQADQAAAWVADQAASYVTDPVTAARAAILADLSGTDPTNFGGVNLVDGLAGELGEATANPYGLALVVIAMARLDIEAPAAVVDALLATQEADGPFGFPGYGTDLDATAIAAQALLTLDDNPTAIAAGARAVDWLAANQCTEVSELCATEGPYWGSYSPANTAGLAIGALRAADRPVADQLAWLVAFQNPDGGFSAALGVTESDAYATAQAVLGLRAQSLADLAPGSAATAPNEPAGTPDDTGESDDGGLSLPVIIGVAVAAGILGGLLAFIRRRRVA